MRQLLWQFLKKLIKLPYDPGIPPLSIYPEKTITEKDTRTPVFTAVPFTTVRTRKRPPCPSTGERIKKLWYIYTMEHHSAIKRNTAESVEVRWMNREPVIQTDVSQKNKYCTLMHIYGI